MKIRVAILFCYLVLSACVQPPVFKGDDHAFIRSNYPIVNVNGNEVEPSYRLDLAPGENTLVIVYLTYQHNYHCTFSWIVVANTVYEVTDQENNYPLTLYRWIRRNSLMAARRDPIDPLECSINKKAMADNFAVPPNSSFVML